MNAHDQLERQLRESVAQNADRPLRLRRGLRSRGLPAIVLTATTALALGVAALAVVELHHGRSPSAQPATLPSGVGPRPRNPGAAPRNVDDAVVAAAYNTAWSKDPTCVPVSRGGPGAGFSQGSPSAQMLSALPILRRPATSADRLPANLYVHIHGRLQLMLAGDGGDVLVRYVRRARVADGRAYYLVPLARVGRPPLSAAAADRCYRLEVAALEAALPAVPRAERQPTRRYGDADFALGRYNLETSSVHEGVDLIAEAAGGGAVAVTSVFGGGAQTLGSIQRRGQLGGGGGGNPPTPLVMDGIVPSGVASVTLHFPATDRGSATLPALSATGDVVNNVVVIPIPSLNERGGWPASAIWRSASGRVIKTVNEVPLQP